ncbi:uncharacterized protein [Blastocystis hominis]|uniref:AMMECR1 domain-containing protein n=1 Tax=Blastocystis hominis TaxID=12968 RepID=D8M5I6_BLAHO|nr:uncharacterized protein [Blastocystis hominis]CBK23325.2 unnamed protein product [Blastocystis hominis]|eukprot:XP_012897373.1 uncharacterized protein [Blastocystis hominis]
MSVVKKEMMMYCFDVILNRLTGYPLAAPEFDVAQKYGIFVTLKKVHKNRRDLRGCIGCLMPITLDNLKKYALYSAFGDSRFEPLTLEEVPELECEVSLLHTFETAKNALDWEVGKHGIMIDFEVDDREFHATFLPEVASEEGWDQKTTLRYLVRKAGCFMFDDELLDSIQCTRYQTEKAYLLFQDYVKMTQERNRDAAEFLKSRGIELKWNVCWNH